jgi:drug/metabolite transporter (DMT)-like permease
MPPSPHRWQIGFSLSLSTAALWGMMPLLLKALLAELNAITIIWCRLLISALLVGAYYISHRRVQWRALAQPGALVLLLLAIAGLLGNYFTFLIGLDHTSPGAAQVLSQLAPLLLLVGGVVLFREAFSPLQMLGLLGVVAGLGLFFHHRFEASVTLDDYGIGLLWLLLAACLWAMFGLAQKKLTQTVNSQQVLLIIYAAGALVYLPGATVGSILKMDLLGMAMLFWVSASMVISYDTLGIAMTRWEASRVSALLTTTPLFTLGYAQLLSHWAPGYSAGEVLDLLSWLGAALVVAGSCVVAVAAPRRRPARP